MMKKKSILIMIAVITLSTVTVISAASIYSLNFTMTANVAQVGAVTVTIDGTTYNDGNQLAINWGTVTAGQYTKAVQIHNNVNAPVTPNIVTTNIPSGWTLTLSSTNAVPAGATTNVNIILTVPSSPSAGSYGWTAQFTASTA